MGRGKPTSRSFDKGTKPPRADREPEDAAAPVWSLVLKTPEGGMRRERVEARYLELKSDSTGVIKGKWLLFRDAEGKETARFRLDDVLAMSRAD